MEAVKMRAAHLVRRGWRATIFLALLAGLAGGVAMAAWVAGRQTASAFDRFLARLDPPDLSLVFCPPEFTSVDDETIFECWAYDQEAETDEIRRLPEVEAAGRGAFRGLTLAALTEPARTWTSSGLFARDASLPRPEGSSLVVEGRWYDVDAPDEVVINEDLAERTGTSVGDTVIATFWSQDELGQAAAEGDVFHGPQLEVQVVGIVRGARDIAARADATTLLVDQSYVLGGPGLSAATPDAGGFPAVLVEARDDDVAAAGAAIEAAFGDRPFNLTPVVDEDGHRAIEEAIDYEAGAAIAFAALAGLAGAVFAGQAISRNSRREWSDLSTLRALGLSRRQATAAATARGVVTALIAAAVAAGVTLALSPIGAVGVADNTELATGLRPDGLVLAVGCSAVVVVTLFSTWFPVARAASGRTRRQRELVVATGPLPPTAMVGLGMAVNGGRGGHGLPLGTAIISVALAAATVAASLGLVASMRRLTDTPERFGAPWDVSFGSILDEERAAVAADLLAESPDVAAAAGIVGSDVEIGGRVYWAHSFEPVPGVPDTIRPVITAGREPIRTDEIALGAITMRQLGVSVGDTITARSTVTGSEPFEMKVVGATLINDTYEDSPGLGAVVTPEWIRQAVPEAQSADPFVVRLRPGADRARLEAELEREFPSTVSGPIRQGAIRNVERIAYVPLMLAAVVIVLAVAALANALVVSTRRQRSQLAVLKALGMGGREVGSTVIWQATALAVVAAGVGVPLGIVAGRWGWRVLAVQLGVASGPVVPLLVVTAVAAAVIVVADVIALIPARRAARVAPAQALRVE